MFRPSLGRKVLGAMAIAAVASFVTGVTSVQAAERLTIATGSSGGTFFSLGTGIAQVLSKNLSDASFTAQSTGGSGENVRLVGKNEANLGLAGSSVAYYARHGEMAFKKDGAYADLRGIMMLYTQTMQIMVSADSKIHSMKDLAGHSISIGPAGSGTSEMARQILDAYGLTDKVKINLLSHSQESEALGNGRIDAGFYLLPVNAAAINEYTTVHPARFISVDEDVTKKLLAKYPFYSSVTIPKDVYKNQTDSVHSVGVAVALIANKSVGEKIVYEVTKYLNEHPDDLVSYSSVAKTISYENALNGMPIELHPGARRYYESRSDPALKELDAKLKHD